MLQKFTKHIQTNFPVLAKSRFYVAVSGGIDSMVLLHLFQHFKYTFGVLHCNFKLRGDESDGDMQFIQEYADENKLNLKIGFFETAQIAKESKLSIQETARMLRYNWFYEQMEEIIIRSEIPAEDGEPDFMLMKDSARAIPTDTKIINSPDLE